MNGSQESLHFLDYWRVITSRKEIVIAVSLLIVLGGILFTLTRPKVYTASCVIQVKEETPDVSVFFRPEMMGYDPLFLPTQFQIIQSGPVIEEVVRRLDLNDLLGHAYGYYDTLGDQSFDYTVALVSGRMKVQQYRDTNLIEIRMFMDKPIGKARYLASEMANEIANVFKAQSLERTVGVKERALEAMHEAIRKQKEEVAQAESTVSQVREEHQITLLNPSAGTDTTLAKMTLVQLEQSRIAARMELESKRSLYAKIMSLSPRDLRDAAPYLVARSAALPQLVADKLKWEVELIRQLESLGPRHPDVVSVKSRIDELEKKITDVMNGMKTGVQADLEAAQATSDAVEAMLEQLETKERSADASGYRQFETAFADLEKARRMLEQLEMRYAQEQIELHIPRTTVEIIDPAQPASEDDPVRPKPVLNVLLSVMVGLSAGIGLAYFVEYLDTSVKTIEDIEQYLEVPVLGVIPQKVKPLIDDAAEGAHAEAYRVLRTNVKFAKHATGKSLCITSGSVGEGKSLTLFNVGCVCAQQGERTVIVDSDLHRPRQHRILGISNKPGLANVLVGEVPLEDAIQHTTVPNLDILPSGRLATGVHGLVASDNMKVVVARLKEEYDMVLLDSPPIIGVSDASLLVRDVDAVLLVIQHRKYPRAISHRAKDMVTNVGANLLGVVLNNINVSRDYTYYYYQQHYYYYPRHSERKKEERAERREAKRKA